MARRLYPGMKKKKLVLLEEAKDQKRIHPLSLEELEEVKGGLAVPKPTPLPRDWGWWENDLP